MSFLLGGLGLLIMAGHGPPMMVGVCLLAAFLFWPSRGRR